MKCSEKMISRKSMFVKVKNIHSSSIIPIRSHDFTFVESVRKVGIQQPLIVRPESGKSGEYELIDGRGRLYALDPDQEVWVEIREATDAEVFRISDATTKYTQRSTAEKAAFYAAYVEAIKKETGEKGAQARVSDETQLDLCEISQYLAINELFVKLAQCDPESNFGNLKKMGINKLYELSKLSDHPELLKVARSIEEEADTITLESLGVIVKIRLPDNSKQLEDDILRDVDLSPQTPLNGTEGDAVLNTRFKTLSQKVLKKRDELTSVLQNVNMEKLPITESTLDLLEKMSVSLRRLTYYSKKLAEVLGKA